VRKRRSTCIYVDNELLTVVLSSLSKIERESRVNRLIRSFGLQEQRDTIVGTPVMKGISGGQKRRLSVASQLMTCPQILFLDEPTSGLDSAASFEIISYLKKVAREENVYSTRFSYSERMANVLLTANVFIFR